MVRGKPLIIVPEKMLKVALADLSSGLPLKAIATKHKIPYRTFRNYVLMQIMNRKIANDKDEKKENVNPHLSPEMESKIIELFNHYASLFFGLSIKDCRTIAYQVFVMNNLELPRRWKKLGMVGEEWFSLFQCRHHRLLSNVHPPRSCKATALYDKNNLQNFYNDLERLLASNPEIKDGGRIFALDEITFTGNQEMLRPNKEGRRWIQDVAITTCCIVNADGTPVPPVMIYPGKPTDEIPNTIPHETLRLGVSTGGWMNFEKFPDVMRHFIKHTNSSTSNRSILIIDNDEDHLSLAAFDLAKENGVYIIVVHDHITYKVHPLKSILFEKLENNFKDSILQTELKLDENRSKSCIAYDVSNLIGAAYQKTMTRRDITDAFRVCGLHPFDGDLVSDRFEDITGCTTCRIRLKGHMMCGNMHDNTLLNRLLRFINKEDTRWKEDDTGESSTSLAVDKNNESPDDVKSTETAAQTAVPRASLTSSESNRKRMASLTTKKPVPAELEKLKRRMIRTVSRLMKEKKTDEEIWAELEKEHSCFCRKLWDRMRSLTLKKLKRLLDAEDRVENIPAVARMTLTDWLLFDLVLVHEDMNIIGEATEKSKNKVLWNLFELVQHFEIEGKTGHDLADSWMAATVYYNSKGHQCSPMLLQRRWYQLKDQTRDVFYKFWFTYRGNRNLLIKAKEEKPTDLHRSIAAKYAHVITRKFLDWEERIKARLVIMPEEFEAKMRKMTVFEKPPVEDTAPDLVLIEPNIETIDLRIDSDSESGESSLQSNVNDEDQTTPVIVRVKTEPPESDIATACDQFDGQKNYEDEIHRMINEEDTISNNIQTQSTNMRELEDNENAIEYEMPVDTTHADCTEIPDPNESSSIYSKTQDSNTIVIEDENIKVNRQNALQDAVDAITQIYNINVNEISSTDEKAIDEAIRSNAKNEKPSASTDEHLDLEDIEDDIINLGSPNDTQLTTDFDDVPSDLHFADDGIELVDDGMDYENGDEFNEDGSQSSIPQQPGSGETPGTPKFDLKLLMDPIVFTTKLDDMKVYKDKTVYTRISEKDLICKILFESKPVTVCSLANNLQIEGEINDTSVMSVGFDSPALGLPTSDNTDNDLYTDEEETDVDENKKVKISSYLLQKPRCRSYNPIQLCKNPDFNTRLRKLNMGFFGSQRNRVLLKACKPMTIDLSKAFESKLINGTMYLKSSEPIMKSEQKEAATESDVSALASIQPSAVVVQSLMDTTDVDNILKEELQKRIQERNKVVSLPDISEVRRINQHLLTAEVSPIIVHKDAPRSKSQNIQEIQSTIQYKSKNVLTSNRNDVASDSGKTSSTSGPTSSSTNKPDKGKCKFKRNQSNLPSWLTVPNYGTYKDSDSLLTLDTLYKMLNVLDPDLIKETGKKNQKKTPVVLRPDIVEEVNEPANESLNKQNQSLKCIEKLSDLTDDENKCQDYLAVNNVAVTKARTVNEKPERYRRKKYCCWMKLQILFKKGMIRRPRGKHSCPYKCICCCQNEWLSLTKSDANTKTSKENTLTQPHVYVQNNTPTASNILNVEPVTENIPPAVMLANNPIAQENYTTNLNMNDSSPNTTETHVSTVLDITNDDHSFENFSQVVEVPTTIKETIPQPIISLIPGVDPNSVPKITTDYSTLHDKHEDSSACMQPKILVKYRTAQSPSATQTGTTKKSAYKKYDKSSISFDSSANKHIKPTSSKETKIFLDSQRWTSSDRPFYVGLNKILLTNIKLREQTEPPEIHKSALTTNESVLPKGVQIVLLPDRRVTYVTMPGMILTPELKASMPAILTAVQEQINGTGIVLPEQIMSEIITVDEDDTNPIEEDMNVSGHSNSDFAKMSIDANCEKSPSNNICGNHSNNDNSTQEDNVNTTADRENIFTERNVISLDQQSVEESQHNSVGSISIGHSSPTRSKSSDVPLNSNITTANESLNISENNQVNIIPSNIDPEQAEPIIPAANVTRTSLLSDLMEKSGILEEDMAPLSQESVLSDIISVPSLPPVESTQEQEPSPTKICITARVNDSVEELTSITSFAELRYAYENGGKFYKLDLVSGLIVPINVFIQKSPQKPTCQLAPSFSDKSVIDLTDEPDGSEDSHNDNPSEIDTHILLKERHSRHLPSILKKTVSMRVQSKATGKHQSNILKKNCRSLLKYKHPSLKRVIDTNINLEDSDEPMEEEYLVDEWSDESSDDEPLAKKAKKMRDAAAAANECVEEAVPFRQPEVVEGDQVQDIAMEVVRNDVSVPRPTQLVLSGDAVRNIPLLLNTQLISTDEPEDVDNNDDDCILGF